MSRDRARQWQLQLLFAGLLPVWSSTVQAGIKIFGAVSVEGIEANIRDILAGAGVTISNVNVLRLPGISQWGTFRNGTANANPDIAIDQGIVVSTGLAYTLEQSYKNPYGHSFGRSNYDPDLGALLESAYKQYDSVIITFDLIPVADTLAIDFVYGSDEYERYVNTGYVDAFGRIWDSHNFNINNRICRVWDSHNFNSRIW